MTPSARLQATIELLGMIETVPQPADALVSGYFRARRYIGSKDRAAISAMTYDVLRHQARLSWWLEKIKAGITPRARFLAYLFLVENKKPSTLNELFTGKKFSPDPLTEAERTLLKKLEGHTLEHPDMPDTVPGECPEWAAPSLKKRFGKRFDAEMAALLQPASLDLRINPLKTTREEALAVLLKNGFDAKPCKLSPFGIRIQGRPALNTVSLLRNGHAEIQDEGSQLVALLVDAKPGERIVDFCAGAGGKTLALAAQMKNKGRIVACDVLESRLKRSAERFRRADVHNIEVKTLNSENDPWVKRHKGMFDRALVDAPCSGTGTWRRNPDQRWRSLGKGLETLLPLQANILASAARLVKPGGRLIYATCSLLPEENEQQIEQFLTAHPEFQPVPVEEACADLPKVPHNGLYMALTPAGHNTDGFFAAVMQRVHG
ncbi:MAG: RsmB/NOP family class I SAM-dependent RNA methyltransferase [Alphaproteobacteria bacterium]|nr:RsmB/NOP family class I SAM-dependent RNA methyltransferase [Alphaproteobacteria bacterium]